MHTEGKGWQGLLWLSKHDPLQTRSSYKASAIGLSLAESFLASYCVLELFTCLTALWLIGRTFKKNPHCFKTRDVSPS